MQAHLPPGKRTDAIFPVFRHSGPPSKLSAKEILASKLLKGAGMSHLQNWIEPGVPRTLHVIQGGYEATAHPNDMLTTILGSCVCTCLCDPVAGVGGMNHFLLPDGGADTSGRLRYGLHAMELLINELMKLGAEKTRLQAKLFGGAMMHDGLGKIGRANGAFATRFLRTEGIACVGNSLGGTRARRIRFWPVTGRAQQLFLGSEVAPSIERHQGGQAGETADDTTFF